MGNYLSCFKAYDVRGVVPTELNSEIAYDIGRAYADETKANKVCIGYDIRLSGPELCNAFTKGLTDAGCDVVQLGMIGTEMIYFATAFYSYDGGIMITASHNPPEYNGFKMVRSESKPISGDTGLDKIEERAFQKNWERNGQGSIEAKDIYVEFCDHLLKQVDISSLKPLKVLANAGNGAAGLALEKLLPFFPLQVEKMHCDADGSFPNGVPNPILEESRAQTLARMKEDKFDFGVAWDGDYDRCFFFDENGNFIEGYYIVGLLADAMLSHHKGAGIVFDPRVYWNTLDILKKHDGRPILCKSGHAFIKEKMRSEDAIYGGEMSAHHYFKSHWYCDSGMIPFLLIAQLISQSGRTLGQMVNEMILKYPCSGEVNSKVTNVAEVISKVESLYNQGKVEKVDGLSVEFDTWRFNLRGSNTEPMIRLNVETKGDHALMIEKTDELLKIIRS